MTNDECRMTNGERGESTRKVRFWPKMRTPGMNAAEFLLGFFPGWLALIAVCGALLLPVVQSCRESARQPAGQAPPLSDGGGVEGNR